MTEAEWGYPDQSMRRRVGALVPRPVKSRIRIAQWQLRGRPLPPPHYVKQRALRLAAHDYGLRNFVETGTFLGDMLAAMRDEFDSLTSIELSDELHERARRRFAGDPKITLLKGDSREVLVRLVPSIEQPTLFWLDAHYSGSWHEDFEETAGGDRSLPVYEELEAVFASDPNHVIYIDDARLFTPEHENWPSVADVQAFVAEREPNRTVLVSEDIIRVLPG